MGPLEVKGIATPEVKFLDRCKSYSTAVNYASSASVEQVHGLYSLHNEKSKALGSGGSTVARLKLKGIDGMATQGVEYVS